METLMLIDYWKAKVNIKGNKRQVKVIANECAWTGSCVKSFWDTKLNLGYAQQEHLYP